MAGTYGGAGNNFFTVPSNLPQVSNQQYYVIVNSTTGVSQIYRHAKTGDVSIGTVNPKTNSFTKDTYTTYSEIQAFNQKNVINTVKNHSVSTATQGILSASNGKLTPQEAQTQAANLISPNLAQATKPPAKVPTPAAPAGTEPVEPAAGAVAGTDPAGGGEGLSTVEVGPALSPTERGRGLLVYPRYMKDTQDRIVFTVLEIKKSPDNKLQLSKSGFSMAYQPATDLKTVATVVLPIQPSISDSNSVDWGSGTLNAIESAFAGFSLGAMQAKTGTEIQGEWTRLINSATNNQYGTVGRLWAAEQAVGVQNLQSRVTGSVLNPNLELLFNGPALRSFNFTFKLSPRTEFEANVVKSIIRFFKENMAVRKTSTELFVKSPYAFRVMYSKGSTPDFHKSINRIKTCALQSCNVDYTPLGSYMTYEDTAATMVSYSLSLQFQEIEPVYNTDYSMAPDEIGF